MLVRMQTNAGGGGSAEAKEMSIVQGSSAFVEVINYNSTTNKRDTVSGSYVWNGDYVKNDFTTSPRSFVALAPCTATVFKADGTTETKSFSTGETFLTWTQSSLSGNKPFQVGVIVM